MSVEKWWNEICGRGKREKPRKKPTQTLFRPPQNPHGGTEMQTRDPSGGRRMPNRLCHEAAPTHLNRDNHSERCETSHTLRNKKRDYFKPKLSKIETNSKNKNILEIYIKA